MHLLSNYAVHLGTVTVSVTKFRFSNVVSYRLNGVWL